MYLPNDLLEQAMHLATREIKGKPRQASLRRSISSAYYALFHLLIDQAASACAPAVPTVLHFRVQRAFDHGKMKAVCRSATGGTLPSSIAPLLNPMRSYPVPLKLVASAFIQLQEARQEADYDTIKRFSRADTQQLIALAEQAFSTWDEVKGTPAANVFLTALLLQDKWDR